MAKDAWARLAFRAENGWWNCYLASSDTMEGSILIGSILLRVIEEDGVIKAKFMACMKEALAYVLKQTIGKDVAGWKEQEPAPEKDRMKPA